jgi:YD repeat-containing protein
MRKQFRAIIAMATAIAVAAGPTAAFAEGLGPGAPTGAGGEAFSGAAPAFSQERPAVPAERDGRTYEERLADYLAEVEADRQARLAEREAMAASEALGGADAPEGEGETSEGASEEDGTRPRPSPRAAADPLADWDKYPASPFGFDPDANENVSANTGALYYKEADLTLPGKNGLDLVIGLKYDSSKAGNVEIDDWMPLTGLGGDGGPDPSERRNLLGSVAYGWSFMFSHIKVEEEKAYFTMADGRTHLYERNAMYRTLAANYTTKILAWKESSPEFSHAGVDSAWHLAYADGKKEYFDSEGKLIGIRDRFGNAIRFKYFYQNNDYNYKVEIRDTYDRLVTIERPIGGRLITVSAPGTDRKIRYDADGLLNSKLDLDGCKTKYEYEYSCHKFDVERKPASDDSMDAFRSKVWGDWSGSANARWYVNYNLSSVRRPSGLETLYEYYVADIRHTHRRDGRSYVHDGHFKAGAYFATLGAAGFQGVAAVKSRKDVDRRDQKVYNEREYVYNDGKAWNYSGYLYFDHRGQFPSHFSYSTRITDKSSGITTEHNFDGNHSKKSEEKSRNGNVFHKEEFSDYDKIKYDDAGKYIYTALPQKVKTTDNGAVATDNFAYDGKGNVTRHYAKLFSQNADYATEMKYDSEYGLMKERRRLKDVGVEALEKNTLSADGKYVEWAEVYENGEMKSRSSFRRGADGQLERRRDYIDVARGLYVQTDYAYVYSYDGAGNLTGHSESATRDGVTETDFYDARGRLARHVDGHGNVTLYEWSGESEVLRRNPDGTSSATAGFKGDCLPGSCPQVYVFDERGNQTIYEYNQLGQISRVFAKEKDEEGRLRGKTLVRAFEYAGDMKLTAETVIRASTEDAVTEKAVTRLEYDGQRRLSGRAVYRNDAEEYRERWEYAAGGAEAGAWRKTIKTVEGEAGAPSIKTVSVHDRAGRLVREGFMDGAVEEEAADTWQHDYLGGVKLYRSASDQAKGLSHTSRRTVDFEGKVLTETDQTGAVRSTEYDMLGRRTRAVDPMGNESLFEYDGWGRLTKETLPFEGGSRAERSYAYDRRGNLTSVKVKNSRPGAAASESETRYAYDNMGRLVRAEAMDGGAPAVLAEYGHDAAGNLILSKDGKGNATVYAYDARNRLASVTDPLGRTESYEYYYDSSVRTLTDRNGARLSYVYDGMGRLLSATGVRKDGSAAPERVSNSYYRTGALRRSWSESDTVTHTYDSHGREATRARGQTVQSYGYGAGAERTSYALSVGGAARLSLSYAYDAAGRLAAVGSGGETVARFPEYDGMGRLKRAEYPKAGLAASYAYNEGGLLKSLIWSKGGAEASASAYGYYLDGNMAEKTEGGERTEYGYDARGALKLEASPSATISYEYDGAGNRSRMTAEAAGAGPAARSPGAAAPRARAAAASGGYGLTAGFEGDSVAATFTNGTAAPKEAVVIVAAYRAGGALVGMASNQSVTPAGGSSRVSLAKRADAASYKAFAWGVNFAPLTEAVELPADGGGSGGEGGAGPTSYEVSYDANGGTGAPMSQTKTHGTALTLSATRPARAGHAFLGWATSAGASSAAYQPGAAYTDDASLTLYALWRANAYTVSYDANGGTGAPAPQTKTHGATLTLSATRPAKAGHEFLGWATSAGASSVAYQPGAAYTADASVTLYAVWSANAYTVNYDANGGAGAPAAQTKTHGAALTLSATRPTKAGHEFLGWATSAGAASAAYQPGAGYTADASVTLYAVWGANAYTVSYDANGGTGAPMSQTKTHGTALTLSGMAPTRQGHAFLGWATSAGASSAAYQSGDSYTADAPVTLYAVWGANAYTVSYDANGGTGAPTSQTKTHGVALTLSGLAPTRQGHAFLGWATSAGASSAAYQPGAGYTADASVTLYAV